MKRISRFLGVFLCLALVITGSAFAANETTIDVSNANDGYFTVEYNDSENVKMKVGVTFNGETVYYNYTPNTKSAYAFDKGNGNYNITLYRNNSDTSYNTVSSASAYVQLENSLAPYLVSTAEVTFSAEDSVGKKAAELCKNKATDEEKVLALHNYISKNFKYNYIFANAVMKGKIKNYTPNTNEILTERRGVCYDFSSLFAAMCRSQGIPCAISKGYLNGAYHAWNMVYVNDNWVAVDLTNSVRAKLKAVKPFSECTVMLDASYTGYAF